MARGLRTPIGTGVPTDFRRGVTPFAGQDQRVATIFYVDPAGSDAADGLSTGTAWQTIAKVNAGAYVPGDQVLFNKTGVWRGTTLTPPSSGSSGTAVTFGAYGTGAKPIISGGSVVTGWSVFSGNTYQAALTTAPTYAVAGTQALTKGASTTITANQWFWASNVLYVNLNGTNPTSTTVEAATTDIVVNLDTKNYVTFDSLDFRFGADRTVRGNAAANVLFTNCNWQWCGYRSNGGVVSLNGCDNGRITQGTWDQVSNDGIWFHDCANLEIDNGVMTNIGHLVGDVASDGIQMDDASFGTGLDSSGLHIHDMTITMSVNSPKGGVILVADPSIATSGGVVERVTVNGGNFGAAPSASNITFQDCRFLDQVSAYGGGIHVDTVAWTISNVVLTRNLIARSSRSGIVFQTTAQNRSNWTIVNNTFVDCAFFPFIQDAPLSGLVENNIFWYTGAAPTGMLYTAGGVVSAQTLTWDYNAVRDPGAGTPFTGPTGTTYASFALWKAGTSRDAHSITGDPLFNNAGAGDYTLSAPSPARDAGVVVGGIGQTVIGVAPDIGAFEAAAIVITMHQFALTGVGA